MTCSHGRPHRPLYLRGRLICTFFTTDGDQWNMTWVGNVSGNPSNSVQFYNQYNYFTGVVNASDYSCLDAGQSNFPYGYNYSNSYCPDNTNPYQIWALLQ